MLRFALGALLIVMLARAFWAVVDGVVEGATGKRQRGGGGSGGGRRGQSQAATKLVRDPVCGTYIVPNPSWSVVRGGTTVYFCSERCLKSYRA